MWGHMTGGYGYGYGMGGGLMMLLFWLIILVAIFLGMRWLISSNQSGRHAPSDALGVLEDRYARGEIDKVEFEQKRRDLLGK